MTLRTLSISEQIATFGPKCAGYGGKVTVLGTKTTCHALIQAQVQGAIDVAESYGLIHVFSGLYNCRPIRGREALARISDRWWSRHSWATAIDLNAPDYPLGSRETQSRLDGIMVNFGMYPGSRFTRRDPMHYEAYRVLTKAEVAKTLAAYGQGEEEKMGVAYLAGDYQLRVSADRQLVFGGLPVALAKGGQAVDYLKQTNGAVARFDGRILDLAADGAGHFTIVEEEKDGTQRQHWGEMRNGLPVLVLSGSAY